jgi:hypothetical protein
MPNDEAAPPRSDELDHRATGGRSGAHDPVVARQRALFPSRRARAPKTVERPAVGGSHGRSGEPADDDLTVLLEAANRWLAG